LGVGVVNGKIYAISGLENWFTDAVEEYDPKTDTWTKRASIPTPRCYFGTAVVDGKIYVMGGWTPAGSTQTVAIYDPETDTWTEGIDMPERRSSLSASVVNGRIYAIGGSRDWCNARQGCPVLSLVEEFDTEFVSPESIQPVDRLAMTWGRIKADRL
jgi:N-acetylneuraminic acid mutarotase